MLEIKTFVFNPFMENTYIVYDHTKEAAIIDCGAIYDEETESLRRFITDNGLSVKHILNTHLHLDHQFGNAFATREFGVLPKAHHADESMIDNLEQQAMLFGIPQKVKPQILGGHIQDNETIIFGDSSLEAVLVPGHSAGSLCFYSATDEVVFVGDVLFAGSIGRTDLPGGNYEQLIKGIKERLLVLPDNTTVYSGHGPTTTIGIEKTNNPFLR